MIASSSFAATSFGTPAGSRNPYQVGKPSSDGFPVASRTVGTSGKVATRAGPQTASSFSLPDLMPPIVGGRPVRRW